MCPNPAPPPRRAHIPAIAPPAIAPRLSRPRRSRPRRSRPGYRALAITPVAIYGHFAHEGAMRFATRCPTYRPRASAVRRVSPQWHLWVDSLPPKGAIGWKPSEGDVTVIRPMPASDGLPTEAWHKGLLRKSRARQHNQHSRPTYPICRAGVRGWRGARASGARACGARACAGGAVGRPGRAVRGWRGARVAWVARGAGRVGGVRAGRLAGESAVDRFAARFEGSF